MPELILASQSPRRRQLLEALGLSFRIELPQAEEETPAAAALESGTLRNSAAKARSILSRHPGSDVVVVAADTLVAIGEDVLGKPSGPDEAGSMLERLSGRTHLVMTGLTLLSHRFGETSVADRTWVTFRRLEPDTIAAYLGTREPYDKAGGYAVQGLAALFVERMEGSYSNVMGLPIEALLRALEAHCRRPIFEWFQ